jgi:DNA-binding phage protein
MKPVKRVQRGRLKRCWKNLSKASKKTGISRPTSYKILEKHPEKPIINKSKTLKQLEKSESYK